MVREIYESQILDVGTTKMKTYVWTLPTRIFHALLVIFVLSAYLTSEWDDLLSIHVALGSALGVLVLYRVFWGVIGPKYSKFSDFNLNFVALKEYLFSIFNPKREYIGHNPAAGFTMVGIIIVLILLTITGFLTYGIQENRGVFAFLHSSFFKDMELFEEIHEFLGACLWLLIGAHVGGVLLDKLLHAKQGTLNSIVNGYKNIEGESVKLSFFQKIISALAIGFSIYVLIYALSVKDNVITARYNQPVDYKQEHALFVNECASCHILYPPTLLPKKSWQIMMANLEDHFGDDASLDAKDTQSILAYLLDNAAEYSTSEASVNILKSLQNKDTIAITQTPFWKKRHHDIDAKYFKSKQVKSKANCKACHIDIEKGLIEDSNIKMPT
jgi:cytochrome b